MNCRWTRSVYQNQTPQLSRITCAMACSAVWVSESAMFLAPSLAANSAALPWKTMVGRPPGWRAHFDVAPTHAVVPARAEGLHGGFLGGEAGGIAFRRGWLSTRNTDFALGENAAQEAVPEALDGFANARNFGDVDAGADNHGPLSIFDCQLPIGISRGHGCLQNSGRRDRCICPIHHARLGDQFVRALPGLWRRCAGLRVHARPASPKPSCDGNGSRRARRTCRQCGDCSASRQQFVHGLLETPA